MSGLQARLGLLTDVQYADKDDREWEGSVFRFREARHVLERAVDDLNAKVRAGRGISTRGPQRARPFNHRAIFRHSQEDLKVVLHLGDIIDGHWDPAMPLEERKRRSLADLEVSAALFDRIRHPKVFVFGNHCLQAPREAVMTRLGMERCYFSQQLCPGWRLIVLDSTALSHPLMEPFRTHDVEDGEWKEWWDAHEGEVHRRGGMYVLSSHSTLWRIHLLNGVCPSPTVPHVDAATPCYSVLQVTLSSSLHRRRQPYNGGVGRAQLVWLKEELSQAEAHRDRVLVTIHHPGEEQSAMSISRELRLTWMMWMPTPLCTATLHCQFAKQALPCRWPESLHAPRVHMPLHHAPIP